VHSVDDGFHLVGGVSAASFDLGGILSSRRLAVGAPRGPHTFNLPLLFIYGGGGRAGCAGEVSYAPQTTN